MGSHKIEVVLVPVENYLVAVQESISASKAGVMRIVLLEGQEALAATLMNSGSLSHALSELVKPNNMQHQHNL